MDPAEFESSFEREHVQARSGPPEGFLDNRVAALIAQVMLALNPALYLGTLVVVFASGVVQGDTGQPWAFAEVVLGLADPVELVVRLVTAIAFITWLHRVSKNTHLLSDVAPEHGTSNAIFAWFVPCANFWLPYQVVSEIDAKNDPAQSGTSSSLVSAWWGAWVATLVLLNLASRLPEDAVAVIWLLLVLAQIVAATLATLVIRRIQKNQIALATRADAHAIAAQFA